MPIQLTDQQKIIYTINEFKSINQKVRQDALPKEIGYTAYNLRYDIEYGSISKRKNRGKYGGMSTLGTSQVLSVYRYYKNSTSAKKFIISYTTTLKLGSDSAGTFTNIKTVTTDLKHDFLTYKDMCYIVNGTDANMCYDGTTVESMGVPIPTAPTLAVGAAGNLTGAYYYKVTYLIDDYQEGSASVASAVVNPSAQKVTVTIPVSTNTRVTDRKIYRTKAGGSVYYLLTTVADNSTLTYSDDISDSDLGTTQAPSDYGTPGVYKRISLHKERAFLSYNSTYKSRTIFSDIRSGTSYPDVFPANNFLDIGKDDGDTLVAVIEDNFGQLIAIKQNSIRKIFTDSTDPSGWEIGRIISVQGCCAEWTVVPTPYGILYLTKYGEGKKRLMLYSGNEVKPVFPEIEPILTAIPDNRLDEVVGHYHDGSYFLAYADNSAGDTFNNRLLIIDLERGTVTIDKKSISSMCSWNSGTDSGELYTGTSDATGFCYNEDIKNWNIDIKLKSEIDRGTFGNFAESGGTEESPTIILKDLTTHIGATLVSAATGLVSGYTGVDDTVMPSGGYTSAVLDLNSKPLKYLYWNETLGAGGDCTFYVRVGSTPAVCAAASWNGPYTTPSGSDISGIATADYVQFKLNLWKTVDNIATYADTYLTRATTVPDDYFIRVFASQTEAESAIAMDWISNWIDCTDLGMNFKRTRKRLRSVRINFDRSVSSGTLVFTYYLDGSSTVHETVTITFSGTDPITGNTYASQGHYIHYFPLTAYCKKFKYRLYNSDAYTLTIKSLEFTISPEPIHYGL